MQGGKYHLVKCRCHRRMEEEHLAQPREVTEMPRRGTGTLRPDSKQRTSLKETLGTGELERKTVPSKSWEVSDRVRQDRKALMSVSQKEHGKICALRRSVLATLKLLTLRRS